MTLRLELTPFYCVETAQTLRNNCTDMHVCDDGVAACRSDDEFTQDLQKSLKIWSAYLGVVAEVAKMLKADAEIQDSDQGIS